ncbi:DoxX-like family protein [Geodermatophilus pulveris]|uniref:DoxX-like family protein n=1 Tax=Geodermatophilus pulveris TaxID=1564159 RepID=A0A239C0M8_9ACTN|nr:DoxX family protein [Geodermatophilus pulveris]SNS13479.1 DoxX-like family protein [Geodermatophilus pulveris]
MLVALWIVQGLLALVFGGSGIVKATRDRKRLFDDGITWVEDFPEAAVKAIGVLEIVAAVGLVLPALTGIAPVLTPLAAAGIGVLMAGAGVVHFRRGEFAFIGVVGVLFGAAVFVAWGRFGPYAF